MLRPFWTSESRCPRTLGDRYVWQDIDEADYKRQRRDLEARLAELPAPADSNVIAFDRAAETILPLATIVRETTPEHRAAIARRGARDD